MILTPQAPTEKEDVRSKPIINALHGRIAVLIPCYNEEITIGTVVRQFRAELPSAEIYVFDNNSIDRTIEEARTAGAIVTECGHYVLHLAAKRPSPIVAPRIKKLSQINRLRISAQPVQRFLDTA